MKCPLCAPFVAIQCSSIFILLVRFIRRKPLNLIRIGPYKAYIYIEFFIYFLVRSRSRECVRLLFAVINLVAYPFFVRMKKKRKKEKRGGRRSEWGRQTERYSRPTRHNARTNCYVRVSALKATMHAQAVAVTVHERLWLMLRFSSIFVHHFGLAANERTHTHMRRIGRHVTTDDTK